MYHPTRGGVRGGRDQFSWDEVKVDKHRENYLGHSIKAPVGRWQKGKDLHWYARDKKSSADMEAAKEEIRLIKEKEEEAMREALGLAPKRARQLQGNRLDKHEFSELVKRGSTAEDLGGGHAEAAKVHGLGFARAPRAWEEPISLQPGPKIPDPEVGKEKAAISEPPARSTEVEEQDDERRHKKRRHEEKRRDRHEKRHARESEDKKKHKRDKERRRRDSD